MSASDQTVLLRLSLNQAHRLCAVLHGPGWADIREALDDAIDLALVELGDEPSEPE